MVSRPSQRGMFARFPITSKESRARFVRHKSRSDRVNCTAVSALACLYPLPGSTRSTVPTRSMDRSKEATLLIPVLSAHATRYASAKSSLSTS